MVVSAASLRDDARMAWNTVQRLWFAAFEADDAARVHATHPSHADGSTLFPFRRPEIVARRR